MERAPPTRGHWPFRTLFLGAGAGGWPSHETSCLNTGAGEKCKVRRVTPEMRRSAPECAKNPPRRGDGVEGARGHKANVVPGRHLGAAPAVTRSSSAARQLPRAARLSAPQPGRSSPSSRPNPQLPVFPRGGLPLGWTLDHRPTGVYCLCFACSFRLYVRTRGDTPRFHELS